MKRLHLFDGLKKVFDIHDDRGRGRAVMLTSTVLCGVVGQLSGGLFYTSFLLQYGLDKSRIGILTFIPYITCLLNLFAPMLLERFPRRKWLLAGLKLLAYAVNIMGITLLPVFVKEQNIRLLWFVVLTALAGALNQIANAGYAVWNANFLTDEYRVDYFNYSGCIGSAFTWAVTLLVSFVGDRMTGTEYELTMLTAVRYLAFALAVVDCIVPTLPKEYPYTQTVKPKFSNIFLLPLHNKRFFGTAMLIGIYQLAVQLPNATLNAYVLEDVGISYTLCNGINATYFLFYIIFSGIWKRVIAKFYWFRALCIALVAQALTFFAYSFVTADTVWLYVVVRFGQHITGVWTSVIIGSLPYVNLPAEDRTSYLSFNTILTNLAAFLSMMLGTAFTGIVGESVLTVFGMGFTATQLLLLICALGHVAVGIYAWRSHDRLSDPRLYGPKKA